jgi:hypothetical protein
MELLKRNYDRIALIVAALLAIVFGGLLAMKALGLPNSFGRDDPKEKAEFGEGGEATAKEAIAHLGEDKDWASPAMPSIPQKKLPLFVSVPILVQNGVEIDLLDPNSASPRPPFTPEYLYKHGLNVGRTDLAELDPDKDGFDNRAEFLNGKTDPNDPSDHPPFFLKLALAEIKKDEYALNYRTGDKPGGDFSIREEKVAFVNAAKMERKSNFTKMNKPFGKLPGHEGRYTITAFQQKMMPGGAGGIPKPAHIITVTDRDGDPIKIAYHDRHVIPTYYAVFNNAFPGAAAATIGPIKVGDSFEMPNEPGVNYLLLSLSGDQKDGAKVRRTGAAGDTPQDLIIPSS